LTLGAFLDPATGERSLDAAGVKREDLVTHGVIVGMTGSGKTGLGVVLLEEVLRSGVPALILDPKGDLGNLALTFPGLTTEEFAPWVESADPASVATEWRDGLASWGLGPDQVRAQHDGVGVTIFTPGSEAGIPLNIVGSLTPPPVGTPIEVRRDEITGYVSGVLGLVGIDADPLSSREHILLANLIEQAWSAGRALDLATLVATVPNPPVRKLGVFDIDTFFPPDDRMALALKLNALLASPSFGAWSAGPPIDIEPMLRLPDGRPRASVISLAHLSDEERQFVVTLVLGRLITWMRRQPGTADLRVLVYFDEVMGFVPPTAVPPSKPPILTLLKQGRAYGVGTVLATQNPVDLDYKAVANAGTWMIGRLQTENDKARLLDGMRSSSGSADVAALSTTIGTLGKRQFLLRTAGADAPRPFTTRWAMSYLRGPLTQTQISALMRPGGAPAATDAGALVAPAAPAAPAAPGVVPPMTTGDPMAAAPPPVHDPMAASAPGAAVTALAAPALPAPVPPLAGTTGPPIDMPPVADGVPVAFLDPAAPWSSPVGAVAGGTVYAPAAVATVSLLFDETKADLRHTEQWEAELFPLGPNPDAASFLAIDHDDRDFRPGPIGTASFGAVDAPIATKAFWTSLRSGLTDHLQRTRSLSIQRNVELKLWSRAGEDAAAFALRCDQAADVGADAAAAKLRTTYEKRIDRVETALARATDRAAEVQESAEAATRNEWIGGAADVLGGFLGGRSSARSIARSVTGATSRRGRSSTAGQRVESAQNKVADTAAQRDDLVAELEQTIVAIAAEWDAKATAIETVDIPLEKTDIEVLQLGLVWVSIG